MRNKELSKVILITVLCTFFTASAQLFMKIGVNKNIDSLISAITNIPLLCGLLFYSLGTPLLIYALKKGDLSVVYPFFSLSFLWVTIMSVILFHEQLSFIQGAGLLSIVAGVSFVGRGAKND